MRNWVTTSDAYKIVIQWCECVAVSVPIERIEHCARQCCTLEQSGIANGSPSIYECT